MWNTIAIDYNFIIIIIESYFSQPTNMYEATKKPNEKLGGLDNQMVQVEEDFDEMMRKRNEEKRKLELKFKDVYQ